MSDELIDEEILDTTPNQRLRRPIPWWRSGLLGGTTSALFIILQNINPEWEHLNGMIASLIWVSPIIACLRVAFLASPKLLFAKTLGCGLIAVTLPATVGFIFAVITTGAHLHTWEKDLIYFLIGHAIQLYSSLVVFTFLLWLVARWWRNRMAKEKQASLEDRMPAE